VAGQQLNVDDMFKAGDLVDIAGTTIGKGFQGVLRGLYEFTNHHYDRSSCIVCCQHVATVWLNDQRALQAPGWPFCQSAWTLAGHCTFRSCGRHCMQHLGGASEIIASGLLDFGRRNVPTTGASCRERRVLPTPWKHASDMHELLATQAPSSGGA